MRVLAWPFSMLDKRGPGGVIGCAAQRLAALTKRLFKFERAPLGLTAALFVLIVGIYLVDIWSGALIAVRQLFFVAAVAAGFTRNFWALTFFVVLTAFLHVQAFREYVPHPQDFTDLHYLVNFVIALVPYALAGYLGGFFATFFDVSDGGGR